MNADNSELSRVIDKFQMPGELVEIGPYGSGHINDTFLCVMQEEKGRVRYIVQRMNTEIFKNPKGLMENIVGVTSYLKKKISEKGGDVNRETLNVIPTKEENSFLLDEDQKCWRVYCFIEDSTSYDKVEKPNDFYQSAVAFGHFQYLLSDYPAQELHETIPDFHNTVDRFAKFRKACEADVCGRALKVQKEIQFVLDREKDTHILSDMLTNKELPLRVTHNDTKLNNIMIDNQTGKGICVIDLDTVMPGLVVHDFGDSIRFGANTASEDEIDLSKVSCDMNLFELYVKGYIEGSGDSLTKAEISMLAVGAKMMTLECGMRFLTDYLEGDKYFKIHRENHNLDRCRTQFKLVADMEKKWDLMQGVVAKYSGAQ